jgi:hypothetical protein
MGISQLECLQLRRLVGPSGISGYTPQSVGNQIGGVVVAPIPLVVVADGTSQGVYHSTMTVPSGAGIMQVTITSQTSNGQAVFYRVDAGAIASSALPIFLDAQPEGFAGYFYQGLMYYSNPSSNPVSVNLVVGCQGTVQVCNLTYFAVNCISFGPYVKQD